jgi:hypothetical protein
MSHRDYSSTANVPKKKPIIFREVYLELFTLFKDLEIFVCLLISRGSLFGKQWFKPLEVKS